MKSHQKSNNFFFRWKIMSISREWKIHFDLHQRSWFDNFLKFSLHLNNQQVISTDIIPAIRESYSHSKKVDTGKHYNRTSTIITLQGECWRQSFRLVNIARQSFHFCQSTGYSLTRRIEKLLPLSRQREINLIQFSTLLSSSSSKVECIVI